MLTQTHTLTLDQMARVIHAAWYTPTPWGWGLPLLLGAGPGKGKTANLKRWAASLGLGRAEVLSPGARGEGAFGVVPVPDLDLGVLTYPAPDWAVRFTRPDAGGVVFVDEITTAGPSLQPYLLALTLDRVVGSTALSRRTRLVAAGNLVGQGGAATTPLSAANANRFVHLAFPDPEVAGFNAYLAGRDVFAQMRAEVAAEVDALAEEARVEAAWPAAYAAAAGIIGGYLNGHATRLDAQPEEGSEAESGAWPSPRSWDMATLAFAGAVIHGLTGEEVDALMAGCVGAGPAAELRAFIKSAALPNTADLLDGKVEWTPDPTRPDIAMAVLTSAAALVSPAGAPHRAARAKAVWKLLREMCAVLADAVRPVAKTIVAAGLFDPRNPDCAYVLGREGIHGLTVKKGAK
jgi:hypothetical protein